MLMCVHECVFSCEIKHNQSAWMVARDRAVYFQLQRAYFLRHNLLISSVRESQLMG